MKIAKKKRLEAYIPTASMSDIAFLLILFFMVTTVFRVEKGITIILPKARATERIRLRRNTTNVWVDREGRIVIEDKLVTLATFGMKIQEKLSENPDLIVILRADQNSMYKIVNQVIEKLREIGALKLTFATEYET